MDFYNNGPPTLFHLFQNSDAVSCPFVYLDHSLIVLITNPRIYITHVDYSHLCVPPPNPMFSRVEF